MCAVILSLKKPLSMTWNSIMGFISSVALLIPILVIIGLRLTIYKSFPALLFYYLIVVIYNIFTQGYIKADPALIHYWGLINNLLDAPLMLFFLTYFSTSTTASNNMKRLILLFLLFDTIVICIVGFNINAITIIMAPGLLTVVSFSVHFFVRQSKITIMHRKATGKALIAAALLFAYGCYSIIYLMFYIFKTHIENNHVKEKEVADTFLIYFLVTTFSSLLMAAGIIIERKRILKLSELKKTRKELSVVYKDASHGNPIKNIALDFDNDKWN